MGRTLLFAVAACACFVSTVQAQRAPIFLEPGHWAWDAVRRLSAAGLAPPASDPAHTPLTLQHARQVFRHAAAAADSAGRAGLGHLVDGYADLLAEEADSAGVIAAAAPAVGWTASRGEARGGEGYFEDEDWVGAQPLEESSQPAIALTAHGHAAPWLSWNVHGGYLAEQWVLPAAAIAAAIGPFDVWAGRRRLHYGPGRGGGIVSGSGLNDMAAFSHRTLDPFEGIGMHVREPFELPWILRALGPTRIEVVGGRISRNGRIDSPWLVFGRLTAAPFGDRLTLGLNRGAIFGGDGNPVTAGRLLGVLFGRQNDGFENQVISAIMRYRPPLGSLPLELHLEFGADDQAGALTDVPTYIAGMDLAAVPGVPALAVGIEHARFSGSCCGNPPWYRNVFFRGSWSDDGRLFAHPLGGHGYEWLTHARLDLPDRGLLLRADAFARRRGRENLFAPERAGRSLGGVVSLELRRARTTLRLDGGYEDGSSWSLHRLSAMLSRTIH